jgi:hypothetical protein
MVKTKDNNCDKKIDDSRFKDFDKVLDPSYGQKQFSILLIGLLVIGGIFLITTSLNYFDTTTQITNSILYEKGLNISYSPDDKLISISFSNPNNDTLNLLTFIQVPFDTTQSTTRYIPVYEYSTSKFPLNITYSPAQQISNINHIVLVTLVKETGNYTYSYSVIPDTENKMWRGTGQYLQKISKVINWS